MSAAGALALNACAQVSPLRNGITTASGAPKAYVVAEIDVTDLNAYREYVAAAFPIIQKYGGRFLTRGGTTIAVEGAPPAQRVMIIEFRDLDAAKAFEYSAEYIAITELRQSSSNSRIYLVEGAADVSAAAP